MKTVTIVIQSLENALGYKTRNAKLAPTPIGRMKLSHHVPSKKTS